MNLTHFRRVNVVNINDVLIYFEWTLVQKTSDGAGPRIMGSARVEGLPSLDHLILWPHERFFKKQWRRCWMPSISAFSFERSTGLVDRYFADRDTALHAMEIAAAMTLVDRMEKVVEDVILAAQKQETGFVDHD